MPLLETDFHSPQAAAFSHVVHGGVMKVFIRSMPALLLCCMFAATASADDRYKTGVPTVAQPRAVLQAPSAPTYRTADSGRAVPSASGTAPLAVPAPRNSAAIRTEPKASVVEDFGPSADPLEPTATAQHVPLSLGTLNPTPEMWFYDQMRQDYNNPSLQVRRNAEQAAAERRARLAAAAWYGVYQARPTAGTTPHMSSFNPYARYPYLWGQVPASRAYLNSRRNYLGVGTW